MPLVILEIKVDVGHRNAVGVEETLEDQSIFERVDQGDAQRVGDYRAGRGSACVVPDALLLGIAAEIPHDQEIGIETHFMDDAELVVQALAQSTVLGPAAVAGPQPLLTQLTQIAFGGVPIWDVKVRQAVTLKIQIHVAALGDPEGVL